jgi:hypothetical protein
MRQTTAMSMATTSMATIRSPGAGVLRDRTTTSSGPTGEAGIGAIWNVLWDLSEKARTEGADALGSDTVALQVGQIGAEMMADGVFREEMHRGGHVARIELAEHRQGGMVIGHVPSRSR